MGDVGEGTAVDEGRGMLGGLCEVGLDGVQQQHGDGASDAEIPHGEGLAALGVAQEDVLDAAPEIL